MSVSWFSSAVTGAIKPGDEHQEEIDPKPEKLKEEISALILLISLASSRQRQMQKTSTAS